MRILVALYAEKTAFHSMAPLAWALRNAGHEVRVASQPELTDTVTGTGLTSVPVGRDHSLWRVLGMFGVARGNPVVPLDTAVLPEEEVSWEYLRDGYDKLVPWWFSIVNDPMVDDLVAACRAWRPDLVLWDPRTFAAPVAATAVGAVHARLTWGIDVYGKVRQRFLKRWDEQPEAERRDPLAAWIAGHAEAHGLGFDEVMTHGHFTIDQLPAPLRLRADLDYMGMRYVPHNGPAVVPPWLWERPRRPRVCLTLGTSATGRSYGRSVDVEDLVRSLAELDAEIVATVSDQERERIGTVPDNVRLETFVPLQALLPTCSAVVHHAGFGSVFTALAEGVPQVLVPQQFDARAIGPRVAAQGAGVHVPSDEADGPRVRDAVARVLADPSYRERAGALRREAAGLPGPHEIVPRIESAVRALRGSTTNPATGPVFR
ncbi:activator-dependent family glycosyltransferase [Nocardiopsis sp. NPDC006938]|uniref:activator-dependent family glycosyltransferase n=1 Tax=Nocardiopsis sp. NPDC006938 TaxID=3364337 RepID=UPI00369D3397